MTTKDAVLKLIQSLPEDTSIEDISTICMYSKKFGQERRISRQGK